jgi:putative SOS response-associated peptidase YedK
VFAGSYRKSAVCVLDDGGTKILKCMRWGLIPSYQKPEDKLDFFRMFNARSETIAELPTFKRLVNTRRCAVAIDGFFEWCGTLDVACCYCTRAHRR